VDVVLELVNNEFLITDHAFDQISDRNNANHLSAIENGQVTHSFVGHERHAFFNRTFRVDTDYVFSMISLTGIVGDVLPLRTTFRE